MKQKKIMVVEQNIVNRSNEIDISDLASRVMCKDEKFDLYYFVLKSPGVWWFQKPDEANLLQTSKEANINEWENWTSG